jgi:GNAT superfamily N-acetyltransferase
MNAKRIPLFADVELVRRIEQAEAQLMAECVAAPPGPAGFARPVAGGVATFADEGSPYNKVAGLGFDGLPSGTELDEIEQAFAARGSATQVELAHLADPAIGILLTERGYRLEAFENVLGLALRPDVETTAPPGIEIRRSGDDEFERWVDVMADSAAQPDTQGVPWHTEFPRADYVRAMRRAAGAGVQRYAAWHDGTIAGGAGLRLSGGIAQFAGAATVPSYRRRGIQSALLSVRLADAGAAGCDVAVITTQPGSKSQQNAQRQGFDLLYTRATLVKPGSAARDR